MTEHDKDYEWVPPLPTPNHLVPRPPRGRQCGECGMKFDYDKTYGYCCCNTRCPVAWRAATSSEGVPNSDETGEMIERVAKALHASLGFEANWPHPECTQCVDAARAAIRAMREPTKETAE